MEVIGGRLRGDLRRVRAGAKGRRRKGFVYFHPPTSHLPEAAVMANSWVEHGLNGVDGGLGLAGGVVVVGDGAGGGVLLRTDRS